MLQSSLVLFGRACKSAACSTGVALSLFSGSAFALEAQVLNNNLSLDQVVAAQEAWCQALLRISADYAAGGINRAKKTASAVIDKAYGFQFGPVAFKPTLASGDQTFRATREGALSYFVGNDPAFPDDSGFALKGWRSCSIDNQVIQLSGSLAITMGTVTLANADGETTTVDKTWGFLREPDGSTRIVVHHSSLPFSPQ